LGTKRPKPETHMAERGDGVLRKGYSVSSKGAVLNHWGFNPPPTSGKTNTVLN